MPIRLLLILTIAINILAGCHKKNDSSQSQGILSTVFGGKEVVFPDAKDHGSWSKGFAQDARTDYSRKTFKIGGKIGEGTFGKIFELMDNKGNIDSRYVVKIFKTDADKCTLACAEEFTFHNVLHSSGIPTTSGAIAEFKRPRLFSGYSVIIKQRVHGSTLRDILVKSALSAEQLEALRRLKKTLGTAMASLANKPTPQFVVDIGEQHLANIMWDDVAKDFFVVDGEIKKNTSFNLYLSKLQSLGLNTYPAFGTLILMRKRKNLPVTAKHFEILIENAFLTKDWNLDWGNTAVGDKCQIMEGLQ